MNALDLPPLALSVRQPWAWALIHAGKDVENRSAAALRHMHLAGVGRLAIHAAKGMTRAEYQEGAEFMASLGVACPPARELLRGGIIGSAAVVGVAKESKSRWFFGPRAIVFTNPSACEFIPSRGALGLFTWTAADPSIAPKPARWMNAWPPPWLRAQAQEPPQPDLFEAGEPS